MGLRVEHRRLYLSELAETGPKRFLEACICGTAAKVTPVSSIIYEDARGHHQREIPFSNTGEQGGPWCQELYQHLTAIQSGDEEDGWGWTTEVQL